MVKNVVTSDKNIKKAVELYGQDKVNATLAKQSAKGATVTNSTTNTVVPPAPITPATPIVPPATPIAPKQNVIDSINALKQKQQVSSSPVITAEPVQPAPVEPTPSPTPAPVQPTPEPAKVEIPAPATPTPTAPKEPVKSPRQILAENLTLEQTKNNLAKYRTGQELYNAIQGNLIKEGTREYNNLAQANPDLVNQYKTYKQDQVKKETINTLGNVVLGNQIESKPVKTSDQFLEYFAQGLDDDLASTYAQNVTNNPEYLKAVKTLDDINTQIADNNKAINALYTDVRASLSSSTPESMVASRIAREARPLIENGMYLAELAQNAESSMNRIYDANKENFEIQMQDRNQKRQTALELYGTIRADEIRQEDIEREDERLRKEIAREEMLYGREKSDRLEELKKQEESNLMIGLLNLGVDPTGMTPEEMRKSYAGAVQNETNYERSLNQANLNLDYAKLKKSADAGDGTPAPQFTPVFNDDGTMKISDSSVYSLAIGPDGNSVQVQGVQEGGYAPNGRVECGAFVNDLIGVKIFGNKLSDKTKNINSNEPVVGGAFIEDVGPYGHVGFIESINEDGSINIIDSNYSKDTDGKIRRDTIAVGSPRWNQIKGFYDPSVATPGATPLDKSQRSQLLSLQGKAESRPEIASWQKIGGVRKWIEGADKVDLNGSDIQGLISNYAKILDPDSVVREGEYAIAQSGASKGKADQIRQSIRTVLYGGSEVLSKDAQKVLVSAMKRRITAMEEAYNDAVQQELGQAAAVMQIPVTEAQLLGYSNIKPSGNQFQNTATDTKQKYSEYDSLRTETKSPSSYTIGTGNAVNINKNTPGLTFLN